LGRRWRPAVVGVKVRFVASADGGGRMLGGSVRGDAVGECSRCR
jgi:hypothetical protein